MNGPRLTEERLRYHLDSHQVMRERMCLALLPLLGPFTQPRPRRPKGGPDGARDIECSYRDTMPTWGAVGFRNGGGNDHDARAAAKKKFRDDLDDALKENPALASFIFFTNVDLTPGDKDESIAYAAGRNVRIVHVFDMEILRNALDSRDGLLARLQYLDIPMDEESGTPRVTSDRKAMQSSRIASCHFPLKLPKNSDSDEQDRDVFVQYVTFLLESFCRCFEHTCVTRVIDEITFLFTLAKADRETEPGYIAYDLEAYCHVTEFVRSLEERLNYFLKASSEPPPRLSTLPGKQMLEQRLCFGRLIPHRIYRVPPGRVVIEAIDCVAFPADKAFTSSALLCILGKLLNGSKILFWEEIETYPDAPKLMRMLDWIGEHGFSWDALRLDSNNPELWEYEFR